MLTDNPSFSSLIEDNSAEVENNVKSKKRNSRTIFGSYQLLRTIGEGEFGKVKLGIKINTQSAVNIFFPSFFKKYIYIYIIKINKI